MRKKVLEEYLVEKFSIAMMQNAKGIPEPKKGRCQHPQISGNYIYYASFDTNYGIFESLCDKFVEKTYGNLSNYEYLKKIKPQHYIATTL